MKLMIMVLIDFAAFVILAFCAMSMWIYKRLCVLLSGLPRLLSRPRVDIATLDEIVISWRSWTRGLDIDDPDVSSYT